MSLTLLNDHVLLPHRPNWKTDPQWSRAWQTQVAAGVTGAESRTAVRVAPRLTLKWLVSPQDLQEQSQLDDRIRFALKSGQACTPYWGRGQASQELFTFQIFVDESWPWAVGDYFFVMSPTARTWQVATVNYLDLRAPGLLELQPPTPFDEVYPKGTLIWPLLFGELQAPEMPAVTSHHSDVLLELRELAAPASAAVVGAYTPPDPGTNLAIPAMTIGSTFLVR